MKKTTDVLRSILLLVVVCILIPAFAPVWITHGLILFMLIVLIIVVSKEFDES